MLLNKHAFGPTGMGTVHNVSPLTTFLAVKFWNAKSFTSGVVPNTMLSRVAKMAPKLYSEPAVITPASNVKLVDGGGNDVVGKKMLADAVKPGGKVPKAFAVGAGDDDGGSAGRGGSTYTDTVLIVSTDVATATGMLAVR